MSENEPEVVDVPKRKKRPIGLIILAVVLLVGGFFGVRMYLYNSSHVTTDDAYVTVTIAPVNAQVSSSIVDVLVRENEEVKQGQVLAKLDDATFRADVDQAKANLAVAEANAQGASADVGLTAETGQAQVNEARGGILVGGSDVATAQANVGKAQAGVATAKATLNSSEAQAKAADEAIRTQLMDRARIVQQLGSFKAGITNAESAVKVAQANLANAQATATNAERDAQRYRALADQGAVAVSQAEAKETAAANARATLEAAKDQVSAAQAGVTQRKAEYAAAQQQVKWAETNINTARAQARAAHQAAQAQSARVSEANSDVLAARQGVKAAEARASQAAGKLNEALALPKRISISQAGHAQALAKVKQAQAALETAELALARTRIVAAIPGHISRKTAQVGQQVAPGQPLMSIVRKEVPWIVANFKETQLTGVKPGQTVEIEIDAIPGHTFHGKVDSIAPGTGSTFALLPPDNATGNFTKVVQRVSVKIVFDPNQPDLDRLAAGLSANVAIIVK